MFQEIIKDILILLGFIAVYYSLKEVENRTMGILDNNGINTKDGIILFMTPIIILMFFYIIMA